MALAALPLTPNGKVDRKALPAPELSALATQEFVAPQGEVEQALALIWQELLGIERVGRHDNFFDLGGHSLLALRLVARVKQVLGADLPLHLLFSVPTVATLAVHVAGEAQGQPYPNLVALRRGGMTRPLFFVHPGEGDVDYARRLALSLDGDMPIYALAASGFMEGEDILDSVEAMASSYLAQIRSVQAEGPYRLAGWSAGGTIAYEMARQLRFVGEDVEFLGLIDTSSRYPVDGTGRSGEFNALLAYLPTGMSGALMEALIALDAQGQLVDMLKLCQQEGMLPADLPLDMLLRRLAVRSAIGGAIQRYRLVPLSIPAWLAVAGDDRQGDLSMGWKDVLGVQLRMVILSGDHYTITETPYVDALGAALSQALLNAAMPLRDSR
jgi:thioesterase domain-containing protein/acyl carrier protein